MAISAQQRVIGAFEQRYGQPPAVVVRAPGRVNVLGAHVDYNDGWVLPGAIDRAVWVAAAPLAGSRVELIALDLGSQAILDLDELAPPVRERDPRRVEWFDYPAAVGWALRSRGLETPGMCAVFGGDLPIGAGVSSSAAVEIAFLRAWETLANREVAAAEVLAVYAQSAENEYLGVASGIMDPLISAAGLRDHLLFIDCRTLESRAIELPRSCRILIADSGVERRLATSSYNDRRSECQHALELVRAHRPKLRALRDLRLADLDSSALLELPAKLQRRVRHVIEECDRVRRGAAALERNDVVALGSLMRASHRSSAELYEVSLPELDLLASAALDLDGCYGARLTGAGFGGCVTLLVEEVAVARVEERLVTCFEERFGRSCEVMRCRVADGAEVVLDTLLKVDPRR